MIQLMSGTWIAALLFAATPATAPQEQDHWPARHLTFEVRSVVQPRNPRSSQAVTHAAEITIGPYIGWDNVGIKDNELQDLLGTPASSRMSQAQRDLLNGKGALWNTGRRFDEGQQLFLYAVSAEDARTMAEALVELCDNRGREHLKRTRKELEDARRQIPETEKKLADLEAQKARDDAELEEQKKLVSYADKAQALQDKLELEKDLRSLQVERVGVEARVETIRKLIPQTRIANKDTEWLERLLASQDIELAGILARQRALDDYLGRAHRFLDLDVRREACREQQTKAKAMLSWLPRQIPYLEQTLAEPPAHLKPLIVKDNVVCIHPLSAPETAPATGAGRMGRPAAPGERARRPGPPPASRPAGGL